MQIHELPTGVPSSDDYVAMDDGTSTRKAHFSGFNAADNPVTFTTRDEASPAEWKGFSAMESGSKLSVLINRASATASNVRYLRSVLGTTALGTAATTITGAIHELVNKIGSTATGLSATTITGMIKELRLAVGTTASYTSSADQTIPYSTNDTSVYAAVGTITLPKGTWLVICKCRFSTNSNGVRKMNFSDTSGAAGWTISLPASSGEATDLQMVSIVSPNDSTAYYMNVWQNSGSNLTCAAGRATIRAIRIGVSAV